jgi:nucleoside-diphosphate-sugar epimerase
MNYCISGKSGFIGHAISNYLIEKEQSVFSIPRNFTIEGLVKFFEITKPDYIVNLASYGNHYDYQKDFKQMVETNIMGTYNLLEAAKSTDYKQFYHVSASSISPSYYYVTKLCGERLAGMYDRVTVSIPYSVYGPGEAKHKFIPTVVRALFSGEQLTIDEDATHDWILVADLIKALFADETELGTGIKTTNKEVIRMLEDISGRKLKYITGKLRNYDNDNWRASKGVPHIDLYEGLKLTYESIAQQDL